MAYTARLSCLFAAACFGAGRHIEHAFVTAEAAPDDPMAQPGTTAPEGGGQPVMTCAFNRESFVRETLSVIGSGELASPRLRFSPHDALDVMKPEACSWRAPDSPDGPDEPNTLDATPITPLDEYMFTNRIPVHRDTRPLPADMQQLFHTGRICDIDTQHPFGSHIDAVQAARADAGSSGIASIAHLESIIEDLEAETVPPDDDAGSRPLFCPNPLARAALPLLDDDLTIAGQAEAFLRGGADPQPAKSEGPRFFRAPNALFDAHRDLSLLYERLGDLSGAAAHADRCIALAPTTAQAYERKAGVLAQKGRYAEAANVAIAGLEATTAQSDAALLYYTLALLLWKLDRKRDAAAVLVYTTALAGEYATKALNAVRTLRKREGGPVIASASPLAASREMARSHIPVVPGDEAKTLVVHAALGLSCADAPAAAAPYAAAMARYFRDDEVIAATARSLARGTA